MTAVLFARWRPDSGNSWGKLTNRYFLASVLNNAIYYVAVVGNLCATRAAAESMIYGVIQAASATVFSLKTVVFLHYLIIVKMESIGQGHGERSRSQLLFKLAGTGTRLILGWLFKFGCSQVSY